MTNLDFIAMYKNGQDYKEPAHRTRVFYDSCTYYYNSPPDIVIRAWEESDTIGEYLDYRHDNQDGTTDLHVSIP